jgi:hypothetical protein
MLSFFAVVDLERVVVTSDYCKLAGVVEVERGDALLLGCCALRGKKMFKRLTLAGRKLDMTSLTFCVGGPAGGGGGPGVADPVTMVWGGRRSGCDRG